MKRYVLQAKVLTETTQAGELLTLPKGFLGYARVRFVDPSTSAELKAKWVPTTGKENRPQGIPSAAVLADDFGVLFSDGDEKLWQNPQGGMALYGVTTAAGCYAVVDVCGEYPEE